MLAEERRKQIRNRLARLGQVQSADLVKEFGVSEDTIRRDLKELADAGLIKKVHGGALATTVVPYEYGARQELNVEAKSAMSRKAVSLVREGMLIFVDGATTTVQIANHLPRDFKGTFVTYSVATATALAALPSADIILLGGKLISDLLITSGPQLIEQAMQFRPDLAIVSAHGLTPTAGATVESYDDALVKRRFIENSAEVVVLAGQEKLGFIASYFVAPLSEFSYLITDADGERLEPFRDSGITIWQV